MNSKIFKIERQHKCKKENFNSDFSFLEDIVKIQKYMKASMQQNKSNITRLLKGFFEFYALEYPKIPENYRKISIREGDFLATKIEHKNLIFDIEDPFDQFDIIGEYVAKDDERKRGQKILDSMLQGLNLIKEGKINDLFE